MGNIYVIHIIFSNNLNLGLIMGILHEQLLMISLIFTASGLVGMMIFAIVWLIRPKVAFFKKYFNNFTLVMFTYH